MRDVSMLDDPAALAVADTGGLLRAAATAGAQVRSAAQAAEEAGLDRLVGARPRALVLLQRPGASVYAAPMLAALLGPDCGVPVVLADAAPGWIGPLDVLVAHTAEATDASLADSVARAVRRGCEVVLSAPSEGPVAAAAAGFARLLEPRVPVPPGLDLPRALAAGLITVSALGLLRVDIDELAYELDRELERDNPSHESFVNPAKALALRLAGRTPLLWATDPVAGTVARYAAATLATNAALVAHAADVAEAAASAALQRALAGAGTAGADIFHDPYDDPGSGEAGGGFTVPPRVVLLSTCDGDPEAATLRRAGRVWEYADRQHPVEEVPVGSPGAALRRAAVLAARFDLAALYLGLAGAVLGNGPARQLSGPA